MYTLSGTLMYTYPNAHLHEWAPGLLYTIPGERTQREREAVLAAFRRGLISVVVATDVAARGLDISSIDRVVSRQIHASKNVHLASLSRY